MPNYRIHKTEYIDETKRVSFKYDGKTYFGYEGDTCLLYTSDAADDS